MSIFLLEVFTFTVFGDLDGDDIAFAPPKIIEYDFGWWRCCVDRFVIISDSRGGTNVGLTRKAEYYCTDSWSAYRGRLCRIESL